MNYIMDDKEIKKDFKKIELKKGIQYKFCTCWSTKTLPFCDKSHKILNEKTGNDFKSLKITPENNIIINVSSKNWKL